jgi:hypothetical protein
MLFEEDSEILEIEKEAVDKVFQGDKEVATIPALVDEVSRNKETPPLEPEVADAVKDAYASVCHIPGAYDRVTVEDFEILFEKFEKEIERADSVVQEEYEGIIEAYRNFGEIIKDRYAENKFEDLPSNPEDIHGVEVTTQEKMTMLAEYNLES